MAYIPEHKKVAFMEALSELIESVIDDLFTALIKEAVDEAISDADLPDEDKVRDIAEEVVNNATYEVSVSA